MEEEITYKIVIFLSIFYFFYNDNITFCYLFYRCKDNNTSSLRLLIIANIDFKKKILLNN